MNRFNNVIFGQKAFVLWNGKLLIMKRKNVDIFSGLWDVPGGKVEEDDDLFSGIAREIKEETGLELQKILLILSTTKFKGALADHPIIFRNIYLCLADGEVALSNEHSEYKWVSPKELQEYKFSDDHDFQEVLKKLPEVVETIDLNKSYSELF